MELRELKSFVMAARYSSVSKAADELGLGQPTVTTHIKKLENDRNYKTPTMLLNNILTCLSSNTSPLKNEPRYSLPYDGLKFEDFLYE